MQYKQLGLIRFTLGIGIPSIKHGHVADYYSQPWEVTADLLGGNTKNYHAPGSEAKGWQYLQQIKDRCIFLLIFDCF